jgi:hypothetical protein
VTYGGNVPMVFNRDAKYSVAYNNSAAKWGIRLIFNEGRWRTAELFAFDHSELVEAVNRKKVQLCNRKGGAFYYNEYGHILVPAVGSSPEYATKTTARLAFTYGGKRITPEPPPALKPGDEWTGPHPGIPYKLEAGDISYWKTLERISWRKVTLSAAVGSRPAAELARRLIAVKGHAGKIYLNERRHFFAPQLHKGDWRFVYLGPLGDSSWFPEPKA